MTKSDLILELDRPRVGNIGARLTQQINLAKRLAYLVITIELAWLALSLHASSVESTTHDYISLKNDIAKSYYEGDYDLAAEKAAALVDNDDLPKSIRTDILSYGMYSYLNLGKSYCAQSDIKRAEESFWRANRLFSETGRNITFSRIVEDFEFPYSCHPDMLKLPE